MKKLWLFFLLIGSAVAQISGAGQVGCNAAATTGTAWTSATAQNTTQVLASSVAGVTVVVALDQTTPLSAGAIQFQGDYGDGTFVNVGAWQVSDPTTSPFALISMPYTLQASTNKIFKISMGGMSRLQLKLTTAITGAGQIQPFTTVVCYNDQKAWSDAAANFLATVNQGGSWSVAQSGNWTARVVGNGGAVVDFAGQNAASPANSIQFGCQFNTSPTTITSGNSSPCQLDNAGNLLAKINAALPAGSNTIGNVLGTLGDNGAAATTNRVGVLPGIIQTSPNNGTAGTQGRNAAVNVGTDGTLWTSQLPGLRPASYHASANFAASSTTDNACIYGNGTNTVLLYRVDVSGVQTTAGIINLQLIRRSTAETGGTSANMTVVKDDTTNYAAANTTPVSYTGTGPTAGTTVGAVDNRYTAFLAASTATPADLYMWSGSLKPQLLIGTGQGICVNLGGALTGGQMSVTFYWEEIANISE